MRVRQHSGKGKEVRGPMVLSEYKKCCIAQQQAGGGWGQFELRCLNCIIKLDGVGEVLRFCDQDCVLENDSTIRRKQIRVGQNKRKESKPCQLQKIISSSVFSG